MVGSIILLIHNIINNRRNPDPELSQLWVFVFFLDVLNAMVLFFLYGLLGSLL